MNEPLPYPSMPRAPGPPPVIHAPAQDAPPSRDEWRPPPSAAPTPVGVIVSGPNHALHAVLTLFTFWAFGGWAWVWLFVALANHKTVHTVDAYGRVIESPPNALTEFGQNLWLGIGAALMVVLVLVFIVQALASL